MIIHAIQNAYNIAEKRKWDKIYWAIDLHGTILPPTWSIKNNLIFYPYAKETLQLLSSKTGCILILFTCSHAYKIYEYCKFFYNNNIIFKYINNNPEVISNEYGNYTNKFYFNILLDDKAGFDPNKDWIKIFKLLNKV